MKPRRSVHAPRLLAWATLASLLLAPWTAGSPRAGERDDRRPRPLAFEANQGQADEQVKFVARGTGFTAFLTSTDAVLRLGEGRPRQAVVRLSPVGPSPDARIEAEQPLPGVVNYVRGARGAAPLAARTYARVRYAGIYPGVDLVYYGRPRELEYDFVVAPGADPGRIALRFDGVEGIVLDAAGDLTLRTSAGELRQPRPVVYQDIDGARRPVPGDYVLDGDGHVRVRLGSYDAAHALVIDPVLAYSTHLGGTYEESDSLWGAVFGIAVDPAGNAYVAGSTGSVDFPATPGADGGLDGAQDVFVAKFSPTGTLVYATYLGGPCEDVARAIAVDAAGNAYVTGRAHGGVCWADVTSGVLVAKLGPTGAPLYSLVFGGSLADTSMGQAIAVDVDGHAYVTGLASSSSRDFPTTPGAFRTEECVDAWAIGTADGFVAKVSADGASLVYSTLLCGTGHDSPNDIAVDASGHAYVAGSTGSRDFPMVNALQPTPRGGPVATTGFIAKLSPDGSELFYSTYLGGSGEDTINGLAIDGQANVYVTGETTSDDFPTTPGVLQQHPGNRLCYYTICSDAFVTKINAAGSAIVYSTYLFGEIDDSGNRIAVDAGGYAYVVGTTTSGYFPILDSFQSRNRDLADAFVAKLEPDGRRLVYASYLGGSHSGPSALTGWDTGSAIAIDGAGNAYVAGYTRSYDFPTTPGAFQPALADSGPCDPYGTPCGDAFVAKITAGGPGVVPPVSLTVSRAEVAPGGALTATWAGLPAPSPIDDLRLYALGSLAGSYDHVAWWPTGGTAGGTLSLTLPADLPPGTYELRLLAPDPEFGNLLGVTTRSRPIRVAPAAADLVVASIATTPAQPVVGQPVAVSVTLRNQGVIASGAFVVDFYKDRGTPPGPGVAGDVRCSVASLAPAAATQCSGSVAYTAAGTFSAWAQVDTAQAVAESDEGNNALGPRAIAVLPASRDLVVTAVGAPPASAPPGKAFAISDTVKNLGTASAAQSVTRLYLSLDAAKDAGDRLLTGARTVPSLAPGAQSAGSATVTIPLATPWATYYLLACADDTLLVAETAEDNNCRVAATTIVVGRPDLVETAVTNPPAAARAATAFAITDTARNQGTVSAGASSTRYYFSTDAQRSADDRLLTGSRSVVALAPGAASTQTVNVTIPAATPPGTYVLLACADDTRVVVESDDNNNCRASAATVTVALPDFVQQSVTSSAGPFRRGTAFTVSDTVANASIVGMPKTSLIRYYLSIDAARNTGDTLLGGSRTVGLLAPGTGSAGSALVTIPSTLSPGTYFVLACADDTRVVSEADEANNCRASATAITVTP